MARTTRYVSSSGSGTYAQSTSSSTPMSIATMLANAAAGDTCYVKLDGTYARGGSFDAFTNSGTAANPIIIEGYNSTPGDGYLGRTNGNGPLITTNMPLISYGNAWLTMSKAYIKLRNLRMTCSFSGNAFLQFQTSANQTLMHCSITHTAASNANNAAISNAISGTNIIDCDLGCTGGNGITDSAGCYIDSPRITSTGIGIRLTGGSGTVILFPTFINTPVGIDVTTAGAAAGLTIRNPSFYNCTTAAVRFANAAITGIAPRIIGGMFTDSAYAIQSQYSATAVNPIIRMFNRTRDNTNPDAGFDDWPIYNAITTDTGGASTDYVDAPNGDLRIISTSPAKGAALPAYLDCGAQQRQEAAGGGNSRGRSV